MLLVLANKLRAGVLWVITWSRKLRAGMAPCFLSSPAQQTWRPCLPYVISQDAVSSLCECRIYVYCVNLMRSLTSFVMLIALLTRTVVYAGELNLFLASEASRDDDGDKNSSCNSHHLLSLWGVLQRPWQLLNHSTLSGTSWGAHFAIT